MKPRRTLLLGALALSIAVGCKQDPAIEHKNNGTQLERKSQWKEAAAEFALSLAANPNQEEVIEHMANAHMQLQEFDQVVTAMGKLAELKPDSATKAEVYRNLAGAFVERGLHDRAEAVFNKAVEVHPKDDQSLSWLAELYAIRGGARDAAAEADISSLKKSLEYLDKVLTLKPNDAATLVNQRINLIKMQSYYQNEKASILASAVAETDKARKKAANEQAAAPQAEIDKLQKQVDELSAKITEATKKK